MKYNIRHANLNDVEAIAKVHIAVWKTTYQNIIPQDFLDNLSIERSENNWKKTVNNKGYIFLVAEDESKKIVGFISGGANREKELLPEYDGELMAIYILKEHQQKGLGSKLFTIFKQELLKRNFTNMVIWVLRDNNSKYFYKKMGGQFLKEKEYHIGGGNQIGVAYGWKTIK